MVKKPLDFLPVVGTTMPQPQGAAQATRAVDSTPDSPYTPAISGPGFVPETEIRTEVDTIRPFNWSDPLETHRVAPAGSDCGFCAFVDARE